MPGTRRFRLLLAATALALLPAAPAIAAPQATPLAEATHGRAYAQAPAMNVTVGARLMSQLQALLEKLLADRREMRINGIKVFETNDRFLPGKIASGLSYLILATPRSDPRFERYLEGYRDIADLTIDDANDTWGTYYYISALYNLKQAGLLERAVRPETLARLRRHLDWQHFVDPQSFRLIDHPNNYYGVAFSIARLRYLLGWEDAAASDELLRRTLDHYRTYSGRYGFADETEGEGRFDRYSVLLIGEIAHRLIETGMTPTDEVKGWLRKSAELMLLRANLTGEGWEYGRSIGAYGETAFIEVLTAAARLGVLDDRESAMAYAFSSRIAARYMDFWVDPAMGSVDLWYRGRRTDAYRGTHRILGENLSLARQFIYTNAVWNGLGFQDKAPDAGYAGWLESLPRSSFLYFARGEHDRGLLTIRDRGHVIGLPLINGAADQHMNNPYFPVPFSTGMLSGSADAGYPQLLPRFTLRDGSVLMPLAWFRDVAVRREGPNTILTYRMDAVDRMGGKNAVRDPRLTVETRYVFAPGRITRTDRYSAPQPLDIASVDMEFAGFSTGAAPDGPGAFRFAAGEVTRFATDGFGRCAAAAVDAVPYQAPSGPLRTKISCRISDLRLSAPLTLGWSIAYD